MSSAIARQHSVTRYTFGWFTVTTLVAGFYLWQIGSAFDRFVWSDHLDGYYDLLARGFLNGHLYLPVDPRPELLALPDPWKVPDNRPFRMLDAALFNKHYYLYHGAAPALFVFLPWRFLTRHDLPQNIAVLLFCFGGDIFLSRLLIRVLRARGDPVPYWLLSTFFAALGLAQCVPFLLQLTLVYEVAIASGYFCLAGGFYFLYRALTESVDQGRWAALCGLFFGLTVGCRPHLGLAIIPAFVLMALRNGLPRYWRGLLARRDLIAFAAPVLLCGVAACAYNYARFGAPLEFGLKYQLGEPVYMNIRLLPVNILPGLYYLLGCAPDLDPVFPFLRLARRPPFNSVHWAFPERYFLEPTTGAFYLYPLGLLALAAPFLMKMFRERTPATAVVTAMYVYSISCILFVAATGLCSQRFEVDFLPYLVFISCVLIAAHVWRLRGFSRTVGYPALGLVMVYSVVANLLYAVQGPFDEWLRFRPANYIRVARWFSPVERFRPVLNPRLHVKALFDFPNNCSAGPFHPLIVLGKFGSRYLLSGACIGGNRVALYSDEFYNIRTAVITLCQHGPHPVELEFRPDDRIMRVRVDDKTVIEHPLDYLMTAPSQIRFGLDETFAAKERFDGQISVIARELQPASGERRN